MRQVTALIATCAWAVGCSADTVAPAVLSESEAQIFLQREQARCVTRVSVSNRLLMVVANGSPAFLRLGASAWELRQLDRTYDRGRFTVSFSDALARRMVRLSAIRVGNCRTPDCTRFTGSMEVAGPRAYLESFEHVVTPVDIEETCNSRQIDRLFYEPTWLERLFRWWSA